MGKREIQLLRVLIEGYISAFAIIVLCMELHKLGLIYGAGWYVSWIVGLAVISGVVWWLLESNIQIDFVRSVELPTRRREPPQPTLNVEQIRDMITDIVNDALTEPVEETTVEDPQNATATETESSDEITPVTFKDPKKVI
jgi:hypothetical protein